MRDDKRRRLEAKGWKIGSTSEFLNLTPAETTLIEVKIALSHWIRIVRKDRSLTQIEFADMVHSSQSRVAKMESGDPSVTLDLLVRSLLALGVSGKNIGRIIAGQSPQILSPAGSRRNHADVTQSSTGRGKRIGPVKSRAA